ncbi:IS1182 family transposase [Myxococcota bacterium]
MKRWKPRMEFSKKEQILLKRLKRTRKLFAFLRLQRDVLFDDDFQKELESMYRDTGAGEEPVPPALLCMALILQGYIGVSDAEAVELTVVDARWQMVLDCLGAEEPVFAQGTLQQFRERLIRADMDRRLLERTRELAKKTGGFDWKKLPKDLRVGIDSRPLLGAGRVEDTFNLLGHAARKLVECVATTMHREFEEVCRVAGIPVLLAPSIKTALDVNWSDPEQRDDALNILLTQVTSLCSWLICKGIVLDEPLQPYVEAVAQVHEQDIEELKGGRTRIRRGVAADRRVSLEDAEMRHGRKSKSKRFNGYKEHVAADLDSDLILACAVTPANLPEEEATPQLQQDMARQRIRIGELFIDRAYINSLLVDEVEANGGEVICKPWSPPNQKGKFSKKEFKIDMRSKTITCPAGQVEPFESGQTVHFDPELCGCCLLRADCTYSASGRGRTVQIAQDERRQQRLRRRQRSRKGREKLRQRTGIEHRLAHVAARKGPKARYRGTRKNQFDLRRAAIIQNLETIQRKAAA